MKKSILLFFIAFTFSFEAESQITKGSWLVGGAASFSSVKNESDVNIVDKSNKVQIRFLGSIGYFLIDKAVIGIKPGFENSKVVSGPVNLSGNIYEIGPFIRYYFLRADNKYINVLSEISYQYGNKSGNRFSTVHSNNISGVIGCEVFFKESVGIEFTIGYSSLKYAESTGTSNTIIAGIAFQFHLNKND